MRSDGVEPSFLPWTRQAPSRIRLIIQPPDIYVDEPYLSIHWDGVHHHVFSEWKGFANSEEIRTSLMKGIRAIRDHSATCWVSDARKLKVFVHEDQKWAKEIWMPLAVRAGLKRVAFVTALSGLGKLTIEDVSGLYDKAGLQSHTFDSLAAARHWVSEVAAIPPAARASV
jgi:hypothetical protein